MSVLLGAVAPPIFQPTTKPNSGGIIDFSTGSGGGVVATPPVYEGESDERGSKVDTPTPAESYSTKDGLPLDDSRTEMDKQAEADKKKKIMIYAAVGVGALLLFWYMRKK